jgi:hypothetical protein
MYDILEIYELAIKLRYKNRAYASDGVHVCWVVAAGHLTLLILDFSKVGGVDGSVLHCQLIGLP